MVPQICRFRSSAASSDSGTSGMTKAPISQPSAGAVVSAAARIGLTPKIRFG